MQEHAILHCLRQVIAALVAMLTLAGAAHGQVVVVYVDADASPGGDGTSWMQAFDDLQEGLAVARLPGEDVDEIWVAEGTYTPHASDQTVSFELVDGVKLLGGFDGTESDAADRNPSANETILSGDLLGNDDPPVGPYRTDNTHHVVRYAGADLGTEIDGFTIRGGTYPATSPITYGAGIRLDGHPSNPETPTIRNCVITDNWNLNLHGGGIGARNCRPVIAHCEITNNEAWGNGGGVSISAGTIRNCTITGNRSYSLAAPLFPEGGGGVHIAGSGASVIVGCTIANNVSHGGGGGVRGDDGASLRLISTQLRGNVSSYRGGGGVWIFNDQGEGEISNCVFVANESALPGGALFVQVLRNVINCTVAANSTDSAHGGGIWWQIPDPDPGPYAIANSILWANVADNSDEEHAQLRPGLPSAAIQYCTIMNADDYKTGTNTEVNPLFIDLGNGNVRLQAASPMRGFAGIGLDDDEFDADSDGCVSEPVPDADRLTRAYEGLDAGAYEYRCIGDVTDHQGSAPDGDVDVFDLLHLLSWWATPQGGCLASGAVFPGEIASAFDVVDVFDLLDLLAAWGPCGNPLGFIPEDEQDCFDAFYPDEMESLEACLEAVVKLQE